MEKLPSRLLKLRKEGKLTQKKVAETIGVSVRNYQSYEYGNFHPSAANLFALAKLYHVSIDYIVGLTDDPTCHW